jgi:hypothetical protein
MPEFLKNAQYNFQTSGCTIAAGSIIAATSAAQAQPLAAPQDNSKVMAAAMKNMMRS